MSASLKKQAGRFPDAVSLHPSPKHLRRLFKTAEAIAYVRINRAGLGFSARWGGGFVVKKVHGENGKEDTWSAPCAVKATHINGAASLGYEKMDCIMAVSDITSFCETGRVLIVPRGPSVEQGNRLTEAPHGLYVGPHMVFGGLQVDPDSNKAQYDLGAHAKEILEDIPCPIGVEFDEMYATLRRLTLFEEDPKEMAPGAAFHDDAVVPSVDTTEKEAAATA